MKAIRAFVMWLYELYHYNHAIQFKVRPSFPFTGFLGAGVMPHCLWNPNTVAGAAPDFSYSYTVPWPSLEVLLRLPPEILLDIAKESGDDYVRALREFRSDPVASTWEALSEALDDYSSDVCRQVGDSAREQLLVKHLRTRNRVNLVGAISAASGTAASLVDRVPKLALGMLSLTAAVTSVYVLGETTRAERFSAEREDLVYRLAPRGDLEIDFPADSNP